jgi:KipI family sensor histidine kinase inhibitor
MPGFRLQPCGDSALLITLAETIDPAVNVRVHALAARLRGAQLPGLEEAVPAYGTVLVHYDAARLDYPAVEAVVRAAAEAAEAQAAAPARPVVIPVTYGGAAGPDLEFVARHAGLAPADVVRRHTARAYRVYLMGFTPGFPYLGELDERLAVPRLETPRLRVPAGSVGLAGRQTGIYPLESPGGWRLIGRTAVTLFDPAAPEPFRLAPGDWVRFEAVE